MPGGYLDEEVDEHQAKVKATAEGYDARRKELPAKQAIIERDMEAMENESSASLQDFETAVAAHRVYHEAPNDVFELIVLQCSDTEKDDQGQLVGRGGLNALRLVSKRCLQVVESVATRISLFESNCLNNTDALAVSLLKRHRRVERIKVQDLESLEGCPSGLKTLFVVHGRFFESLAPLSSCKDLETLDVYKSHLISDFSPLSLCTRLRKIVFLNPSPEHSYDMDLSSFSSLPLLEELHLSCGQFEDISPLSHCKKLNCLSVGCNMIIKDLTPLSHCPDLEELGIHGLPLITDLNFLEKGFSKLRLLRMGHGLSVDDLSPLTKLKNLEELNCFSIPSTTSLLPLVRCRKLVMVRCYNFALDLDELRHLRPDIKFSDGYH